MESFKEYIENGDNSMKKEKYMDAIRSYTTVYNSISEDSDEKAEVCYKLSQSYFALEPKNIENPMKYAQESLKIHENLKEDDMKVLDFVNMGYINLNSGKRDQSLKYFEDAIVLSEKIKDIQLMAMANNAKAEALSSLKSKYNDAMAIYDKVIAMTEKSNDWDNYFEAIYGKLNIMRNRDLNEAFEMGKRALDKIDQIMNTIKTKKEKREFKSSLGYVYDITSGIAMELENIDDAMKIAARSKDQS